MGEREWEMDHFSHRKHPLKLIENLEKIDVSVGGDTDEKKEFACDCYGCQEPIVDGSVYGCISCRHFLHETCAKLAPTFNHPLDPLHPLKLVERNNIYCWYCDVCGKEPILGGLSYWCSDCNFDACLKCVASAAAQESAAVALKEDASTKIVHQGHPKHTLTLQLRPAAFHCDACKTKDEDLFYQCDSCDFWIHKTCTSLSPTIDLPHHPNHPLVLVYSLPDNFYNVLYFCELCNISIQRNDWLYHCANCRYFAHIKCVLNAGEPSTLRNAPSDEDEDEDIKDLLHFPMSEALIDPLKLLHSKKTTPDEDEALEINHTSHGDHPLILNINPKAGHSNMSEEVECNDESTLIKVCYACVRPLNSLPYYTCTLSGDDNECSSFALHKYCVELPVTLKHKLHPEHDLQLVDMLKRNSYRCKGCLTWGNTFVYSCETCGFHLDVNCVNLPDTIKHKSHNHPLIQDIGPNTMCKLCNNWYHGIIYDCKACNFHVNMHCAVEVPRFLAHRYCDGHEIPLVNPPVENHPENFYCEICETEMHPKMPLYYCRKCKNSFHLDCLSQVDYYANVWKEGTLRVSYHKHPLTYVRRKKMSLDVCSSCNQDINGRLILECRARVCNFNICYQCHIQ